MERKVSWNIGANVTKFNKGFESAEQRLKRFGNTMGRVGRDLSAKITAPIIGLGAISTKVFADFEQEMAKVKAISGASGAEFETLEKSARELGKTTQFTASQVATLQVNLSKLGFNPTQINQSTASILDLALATGEDLATSATVAASTLRGFSLEATEMERVVNVMADSFSSTALDLNKFETAMATVAPVAKVAGASLEETTAIMGVLANRGVDASTIGSGLRNVFLDIADSGSTWSESMDKVLNSVNPLKTAMELFGKRGATVATIIANNREEIAGLTKDFKDSSGEARSMASIMEGTLSGSFNKLRSALEGAAITLAESFAPKLKAVTDRMTDFISKLDSETIAKIAKFAAILAAIPPLLIGISLAIKGITLAMGLLSAVTNSTFLVVLASIGATVAGIGILSIAIQSLVDNAGAFKERFVQIWVHVKNSIIDIVGSMVLAISRAIDPFNTGLFNKALLALEDMKSDLPPITTEFTSIGESAGKVGEKISNIFTGIKDKISDAVSSLFTFNTELEKSKKGASNGSGSQLFGFEKTRQLSLKDKTVSGTDSTGVDEAHSKWKDFSEDLANNIIPTISSALGDAIGSFVELTTKAAISGGSFKSVLNVTLTALADLAIRVGKIAIGVAIAIDGIKKALQSLNPAVALAAGIGLIALGTIAKSALAKSAVPQMATGGIVPSGFPNDTYPAFLSSGERVIPAPIPLSSQSSSSSMSLSGEFKVKGTDLILVLEQAKRKLR